MLLRVRAWFAGPRPRRLFVRLLQAAGVLLGVYVLATSVLAYHYRASLPHAAAALARCLALRGIDLALRVYDPCTIRIANLGPGAEEKTAPVGAVRAEEFFHNPTNCPETAGRTVRVVKLENETIQRGRFPFAYQPFEEPRLQQLRKKYRLDEIVAGASCEFEEMVRLRSWSRSQFRRHDYQPLMDNFDALEILDRNLRNDNDRGYDDRRYFDPCHLFPFLYCQVMASMGHTARLVSINHGMTEVWSNQYKKWVVMDAELDWHYEKNGVPLSMIEMRDENFTEGATAVRIRRGNQKSGDASTTLPHLRVEVVPVEAMIKYHLEPIAIVDMRNDWMTNHYFKGHPRRGEQNSLTYDDPRLPSVPDIDQLLRPKTSRREDMYWTLNQTEIWVRSSSSPERIELIFRTVTPNFDCFEIQIDEGKPIRSESATFTWRPHEGENALAVRTINKYGVRGITSAMRIVFGATELAGAAGSD